MWASHCAPDAWPVATTPSHIAPPTTAAKLLLLLLAESQKECRMKIPSTNNYTVHCCSCLSRCCCPSASETIVIKLDNAICTLLHSMGAAAVEDPDDPEAPPSLGREKYYSAACTFFSCWSTMVSGGVLIYLPPEAFCFPNPFTSVSLNPLTPISLLWATAAVKVDTRKCDTYRQVASFRFYNLNFTKRLL